MKEDDVSSRNVNPRSNRNSVASASASASATPVDSLRRRARSPSPPQTAAARYKLSPHLAQIGSRKWIIAG